MKESEDKLDNIRNKYDVVVNGLPSVNVIPTVNAIHI